MRALLNLPRTLGALVAASFLLATPMAHSLEASNRTEPTNLLGEAQRALDAGRAEEALKRLDRLIKKSPGQGELYLMRSTAHFMMAEIEKGQRDLDRALELDPTQRQAWLNRAALNLSQKRYDSALEAFEEAGKLDPSAADTDLNVGATLMLKGDTPGATRRFERFLERSGQSAEAFYLVASNYAMAGLASSALNYLAQSIALDETARLRSRTDANFADLATVPEFHTLLNTDSYVPPPSAYSAVRSFELPYRGPDGGLFGAVMTALQLSETPVAQRAEVTAGWALIWADLRIKVTSTPDGKGQVQLSAPTENFTPTQWQQRTEQLFRDIAIQALTQRY